jgi:hypothetical protein
MLGHRNARNLLADPPERFEKRRKRRLIPGRGKGAKVVATDFVGIFSDVEILTRRKRPESQFRAGS